MISFGDPGGAFQCDRLSAIEGCAAGVVTAIVGFYLALVVVNLMCFKDSYFGDQIFGWRLNRTVVMRWLVTFGVFFTYFAFVCRVTLISAIEALFLGMLLDAASAHRWNLFGDPSLGPCWWVPLTIFAAGIHMWVERSRLGKSALTIQVV